MGQVKDGNPLSAKLLRIVLSSYNVYHIEISMTRWQTVAPEEVTHNEPSYQDLHCF